jgi:hypothetical protein
MSTKSESETGVSSTATIVDAIISGWHDVLNGDIPDSSHLLHAIRHHAVEWTHIHVDDDEAEFIARTSRSWMRLFAEAEDRVDQCVIRFYSKHGYAAINAMLNGTDLANVESDDGTLWQDWMRWDYLAPKHQEHHLELLVWCSLLGTVLLASAINKLPMYKGIVFRWEAQPNSRGFLSAAKHVDSISDFESENLLILQSITGRDISQWSENPEQGEVIFLPLRRLTEHTANVRFVIEQ